MARAGGSEVSDGVVAAVCVAQVLGMAGFSAVPALLPELMALWSLSNAEGGWLAGAPFAGYVASVLFVVALSDRVAARRLYLVCAALGVLANLLFVLAGGLAPALALRVLAGVALAGTYMPGLKALSDGLHGDRRARVVGWYTVSFTVGAGLSFMLAGYGAASGGWRAAFAVAAAASGCGLLLAWWMLPRGEAGAGVGGGRRENPWQFLPVVRNRAALSFVLAYAAVIWACAGVRQWLVVFLDAAAAGAGGPAVDVYLVAGVASILGVPAGLLGNEIGIRHGMRRTAIVLFAAAALASPLVGALVGAPGPWVVACVLVYAFIVQGNVSNLTAGVVAAAEPRRMGATMALHSFIGFSGGILGPLCFGLVLDGAGGAAGTMAWVLAYGSCGVACAAGALSLAVLREERPFAGVARGP